MKDFNQQKFNLMRIISKKPEASQRELAKTMEISLGKLNYVLQELRKKGLVKINNFKKNPNKSKYLYYLTPQGVTEKAKITLMFMKRKMEEYEELKSEFDKNKKK